MRLGLVGFGIASGNGAMNSDICRLSPFVTKWLIPNHPNHQNHESYINLASKTTQIYIFNPNSEDLKELVKSFFLKLMQLFMLNILYFKLLIKILILLNLLIFIIRKFLEFPCGNGGLEIKVRNGC